MDTPSAALNVGRQRHPAVPSSNQPPIPEWANSFWYMIRIAALQARRDLDDNAAAHVVNFMASMAVVLPCPDCRMHFVEDWHVEPFTMDHARSPVKAMHWVEELRLKVERRVQAQRAGHPHSVSVLPGAAPMSLLAAAAAAEGASLGGADADADADDEPEDADDIAAAAETAQAVEYMTLMAPRKRPTAGAAVEGSSTGVGTTASATMASMSAPGAATAPMTGAPTAAPYLLPPLRRGGRVIRRAVAAVGAPAPSTARATPALRQLAIKAALQVTHANQNGYRIGCACAPKHK